jgi:hypothetical protein
MIPRVLGYLCPGDMGLGPPAVEQNTLLERLTSGRNYDGVILAPSIRLRFRQWNSSVCSLSASNRTRSSVEYWKQNPPFLFPMWMNKFCKPGSNDAPGITRHSRAISRPVVTAQ